MSRIWEKKEGKYDSRQDSGHSNFSYGRYVEKCFTQMYRDLRGDARHAGAYPDGLQHGGRKSTKTSVTYFCYKRMNLSLEEFKNIIFFLKKDMNCWDSQTSRHKSLFNQRDLSPRCHVNATSRKSLEI